MQIHATFLTIALVALPSLVFGATPTLPFSEALLADTSLFDALAQPNDTTLDATPTSPNSPYSDILRRASSPCASGYFQCSGQPSLCCSDNTNCEADARGMIGCCPHGAACTGYVGSEPSGAGATSSALSSASSASSTMGSTTSNGGVVGSLTATGTGAGQTIFAAEAPVRRGQGMGAAIAAFVGALVL